MSKRFEFIEDGSGERHKIRPDSLTETSEVVYPVLAMYDFNGKGPRKGITKDIVLYEEAGKVKTRGELLKPRIIRIMWILIRIAISLAIMFLFLSGRTFNCMGTEYHWR